MEFLRRYWFQIRAFFMDMPPANRLLLVSLALILLLVGGYAMLYAGKATMVPVSQFAVDKQADVVAKLKAAGIDVQTSGTQVLVPEGKQIEALSILQQSQLLNNDFSSEFDRMLAGQTIWSTSYDKQQSLLLAKMKVLGQLIAKMAGVQSAQVMITQPKNEGFGATHVHPTAAVAVIMQPRRHIDKQLVEAIAGWVKGAVAEMEPQDVTVIDNNMGRSYTVRSQDDPSPSDQLERIAGIENYHRQKIIEALGYIPGLIVAVNVRTDPVVSSSSIATEYTRSTVGEEKTTESNTTDATSNGEPGVHSNTGATINSSAGAGRTQTMNTSETKYQTPSVAKVVNSRLVGGMPQQINVTLNVPHGYFVSLYRQGKPADTKEPDEAALKPMIDAELDSIKKQVQPLIAGTEMTGVINASMVPDAGMLMAMHDMENPGSSGGGAGSMLIASEWVKPAGLGVLGLMSLVLMFGMVRKATHQQTLPSIEELAGVPPSLAPVEDDLVGEAEESEAGMAGVELNDDQIRSRKMAEQIGDLVKSNPAEAAGLFHRWIRKDE